MNLATLRLAFTRHVLDLIAQSDGQVVQAESDFVERTAPDSALAQAGLIDEFGARTVAFEEAREEALARLPVELSLAERLSLLDVFFELVLADGELDRGEGSMLFAAAKLLGITPQQFDQHLDSLDDVGQVDLDAPLEE
jgi:uncharacterized tellurite resistance protein B-like protein